MTSQSAASVSGVQAGVQQGYKIFSDSVHGHIRMHPLLVDIIDTPAFQRLRYIKQMGGIYHVFPGASHNRFEHSIGVCHLAGELIRSLKDQQTLKKEDHPSDITSEDMFCVQIAGLCHDLGHGPFSHLFEEVIEKLSERLLLLKEKRTTEQEMTFQALKVWKHEAQSGKMFDLLIENGIKDKMKNGAYNDEDGTVLKFEDKDFKFIHELIEPPQNGDYTGPNKERRDHKPFLYEIVANKLTGIDVDKMDYISRDCLHLGMKSNFSHQRYMMFARLCTNESEGTKHICMRDKEAMNMYELFHNRYILYHNVCHHRVNAAIEMMIIDAFLAAEGHFKTISEAVVNPKKFLKLTDDILQEIKRSGARRRKAKGIITRIENRDLYQFILTEKYKHLNTLDSTEKCVKAVKEWIIKANHSDSQFQKWIKANSITEEHFALKVVKLNYGKKEEDPIKHLRFYRKNNPDVSVKLEEEEVSHLLPKQFSEVKVMLFYKGVEKLPENPPTQLLLEYLRELEAASQE